MQKKIRAVYMRGGTSKALFFHNNHLPREPEARDRIILQAMGSPDPFKRQADGMGGAISSMSKVAIVYPSENSNHDLNYLFGQVSVDKPIVSYTGNCGNISSAVGPFAIEEGLVNAQEPTTEVRIFQVNTKKTIIARVPVKNGYPQVNGTLKVDGVPGTGAKISLDFLEPAGAVTGKLLPTGNLIDSIEISGPKKIKVSIIDASNPVVFVDPAELGLNGSEITEIDSNSKLLDTLELIRAKAASIIGVASSPETAASESPLIPYIAFISKPEDYYALSGNRIGSEKIDICARMMSMGILHKAYPITGAICTAGAVRIPGTIPNKILSNIIRKSGDIRLGHPTGSLSVNPVISFQNNKPIYEKATVYRTARRLMDGYVNISD